MRRFIWLWTNVAAFEVSEQTHEWSPIQVLDKEKSDVE